MYFNYTQQGMIKIRAKKQGERIRIANDIIRIKKFANICNSE